MLKKKKPVLDEREMLELYRVEHFGFWLIYGLLCVAVLVQLLMGAEIAQMAGELAAVVLSSIAMVIANVRHGIWDMDSRPSVKGNAMYALAAGVGTAAICFAALTVLMRYMQKRQAQQEKELENE